MTRALNPLEEFDILSELQFPEYIYSIETIEEQISFSKYISFLPNKRLLLLHENIFEYPFIIASLTNDHVESILKDGGYSIKKVIINNLSDAAFITEVFQFTNLLDKYNRTTENNSRVKNILQYLKDNRFII